MKFISRFMCMILATNLIISSVGMIPAQAAVSLAPNMGPLSQSAQSKTMDLSAKVKAEAAYSKVPLSFEANHGQTDASVKFLARGKGYNLFLTAQEAVLTLKAPSAQGTDVVRMSLKGANTDPVVQGLDVLAGQSNYMTGNDKTKWHTNVARYSKVEYKQVYSGIDMVYYGNQGQLEYDFIVAPGANPDVISMDFKGAKNLEVDKQGNLILSLTDGKMAFNAPVLYQKTGGVKQPVEGRFVLAGNDQVRFEVGAYDKTKELVIDPSLTYSTFLGTTVEDRINGLYVDDAGFVYMTGQTATVADLFPGTAGHFQAANHGGAFDAFVIKLNPQGAIVWATYLGGAGDDIGLSIAVNASNIVYICGSTTFTAGAKYPTTVGAYQAVNNGGTDGFLTAIAADGNSLVFSTFIGGAGEEFATALTVNTAGDVYVTGGITSDNTTRAATAGAYQVQNGGPGGACENAFVAKFNAAGTIQFFTYLGGSVVGGTRGKGITLDSTGNIFVTGYCRDTFPTFPSGVLPLSRAFKLTITGAQDAFVSKLSPTGANLLYSTYLGGSGNASGNAIKLDSTGNIYVAGDNDSTNFPDAGSDGVTTGMPKVGQTTVVGNFDCFIMKLKTSGTGHSDGVYCTFLGGSGLDNLNALQVDASGNAYVTGRTESGDFVSVSPTSITTPLDSTLGATAKAFITVIGPAGDTRVLNTYLGGVTDQEGKGISVDVANNIFVAGWTNSADFPTAVPLFAAKAGDKDGFIAKISPVVLATLPAITSVTPNSGTAIGAKTVVINGSGFNGTNGVTGVKFGTVNAASYVVNSSTYITAVTPAHTSGVVDVRVTNPVGTTAIVSADQYSFLDLPVVTGVIPAGGIPAGGTTVVIHGSGFTGTTGAAGVKFDTLNAASYTVNSSSQITAVTPAHAAGIVHITITNTVGSSSNGPDDIYTYFLAGTAPTITRINPAGGVPAGGTSVVIFGTGFTGINTANGIKFGAVNAASYTVNTSTRITAISPAQASGIVDIVATSLSGTSPIVAADKYTYFATGAAAPAITSVDPAGGVPTGGTTVVITGSGFTGVTGLTGVKFGIEDATSYTVDSNTQITAISPAQAAGLVDIVVTSPVGASPIVTADNYTYFAAGGIAPSITSLTPTIGTSAGGTTVVITGTGFTGVTGVNGVKFDGVNATSYSVDSNTQITAVSPAHAVGIVDVVVTNPAGSSSIVDADKYTYFLTPVINGYFEPYIFPSPTTGSTAGIAYFMSGSGVVNIRVYNEIGNLMFMTNERKSAGTQGSNIDVGRLAPGVYLYLLKMSYDNGSTDKFTKRKFVVLH
jgi:hypothetical protein